MNTTYCTDQSLILSNFTSFKQYIDALEKRGVIQPNTYEEISTNCGSYNAPVIQSIFNSDQVLTFHWLSVLEQRLIKKLNKSIYTREDLSAASILLFNKKTRKDIDNKLAELSTKDLLEIQARVNFMHLQENKSKLVHLKVGDLANKIMYECYDPTLDNQFEDEKRRDNLKTVLELDLVEPIENLLAEIAIEKHGAASNIDTADADYTQDLLSFIEAGQLPNAWYDVADIFTDSGLV